MVGVGIGALATNQTLAITVTLIWAFVVEALVVGLAPDYGRWLPGGAAGTTSGASTYSNLLPIWAAALASPATAPPSPPPVAASSYGAT